MPFEERNITNLFSLFNKEKLSRYSKLNIKVVLCYLSIYLSGSYQTTGNRLSFPGISSDWKHTLYILRSFTNRIFKDLVAQVNGFLSVEGVGS